MDKSTKAYIFDGRLCIDSMDEELASFIFDNMREFISYSIEKDCTPEALEESIEYLKNMKVIAEFIQQCGTNPKEALQCK